MIKNWTKFIESISGWELVGKDMGPNYPQQKSPQTITKDQTTLIEGSDGLFYSMSDFLELYNETSKRGPIDPNLRDFNKDNLELLLQIKNK
jgi:hypothetical protein